MYHHRALEKNTIKSTWPYTQNRAILCGKKEKKRKEKGTYKKIDNCTLIYVVII